MRHVVTSTGFTLTVSGISRRVIDAFLLYRKKPTPPLKTVLAYKGFKEKVPDYEDPVYQEEYIHYVTAMAMDKFYIVISAVTFDINPLENEQFLKLIELGVADTTNEQTIKSDFLRFVVFEKTHDVVKVMEEILYLSTVTQKGIDEAGDLFDVTWLGKRVELFGVPGSKAKFSSQYEDREAAQEYHVKWNQFVDLTGQEQSAIVAHYRLKRRLAWLDSQDRKSRR